MMMVPVVVNSADVMWIHLVVVVVINYFPTLRSLSFHAHHHPSFHLA
jgi:hypothetical protein